MCLSLIWRLLNEGSLFMRGHPVELDQVQKSGTTISCSKFAGASQNKTTIMFQKCPHVATEHGKPEAGCKRNV